jgi:hypothetical protein
MKIVRARVLVDHIVRFYLDDGTHVDRDFALVRGEVFRPEKVQGDTGARRPAVLAGRRRYVP